MKKLLLGTLTLVLIFALAGWATETRVTTLGMANNIVMDDYNIFWYPSVINMYRNLVAGEVASASYVYPAVYSPPANTELLFRVGSHYDFGEDNGVVGVYIDRMGMMQLDGAPDVNGDGMVDSRLMLFYGRPFGNTDFGVKLDVYHDSYKVDGNSADKTEQANTALGIKVGLTLNQNLDLALGFGYATWTNKDTNGDDVTKPESNMDLNLMGRYWYEYSNMVYFIPHLGFDYMTSGYKDAGDNKTKTNSMTIDLGCGANIRPEEHILLLFDLGIDFTSMTDKDEPASGSSTELKSSYIQLPYYRVGFEGYVTDWWTVRLGAMKTWLNISEEQPAATIYKLKWGATSTETYLGSGFMFGNLCLDAWLDPMFVLKGPNFVSGYDGTLAGMASIKYTWGM